MNATVTVKLTAQQVDMLRGVLYEYYRNSDRAYADSDERRIHMQLENILADAEDSF